VAGVVCASPVRGCFANARGVGEGEGEGEGVGAGVVTVSLAVAEGVDSEGVDEQPASVAAATKTRAGNATTETREDR